MNRSSQDDFGMAAVEVLSRRHDMPIGKKKPKRLKPGEHGHVAEGDQTVRFYVPEPDSNVSHFDVWMNGQGELFVRAFHNRVNIHSIGPALFYLTQGYHADNTTAQSDEPPFVPTEEDSPTKAKRTIRLRRASRKGK